MSKYISCTDTAKLIRKELKANFPGIKFSVKSSSYSGGASISIRWTDGPARPTVEKITNKFAGARFDGMYDSTTYVESEYEGEAVRFGADYVNCSRNYSRSFLETVVSQFCTSWGIIMLPIVGTDGDAWIDTRSLDYSKEHWLMDLIGNTDAKDASRVYEAEKEQEARERAEFEKAYAKQQAEEKAQAEREEQERLAREQAEFNQWKLTNDQQLRQQFNLWKQEQEQLAREEAERQEAQHQAEEKARRERQQQEQEQQARRQREQRAREQFRSSHRTVLASREQSLQYLGLSYRATRADVVKAFRNKVKASSDGKGGYTIDMDFLVKVKEKALG